MCDGNGILWLLMESVVALSEKKSGILIHLEDLLTVLTT